MTQINDAPRTPPGGTTTTSSDNVTCSIDHVQEIVRRRDCTHYDIHTMMGLALLYASWDWLVFPCWWTPAPGVCACPLGAAETTPQGGKHTKGKHPITPNGFKDAMTYPPTIIRWWTQWPEANIGLVTGEPGPDVVDIDVKDGRPGNETMERLKTAGLLRGLSTVVRTPSGGVHLYFAGTTQRCGSRTKDGIDFRSDDGYVLAPGSMINGIKYEVLKDRPREEAGTVDWAAICRYLDPPKPEDYGFTGFGTAAGPGLAAWARRKLDELLAEPVEHGKRSERFHALVGVCKDAGMSVTDAVVTLTPWCDATGKYSGRVEREVQRCWGKVETR